MATEESLELEIEASAKKANAALDSLIKKLGAVSSAIGGVDTSALGNFAKNINGIAKNGGLKDAKAAIDGIDKSVKNLGKRKTKVNVDVKTGMDAISELQKKFADIGKDTNFSGSTSELQKEYDKLSTKLDKLSEKEQKALATGTASTGKNAFVSLQYDIADTLNKMDELSAKIKSVSSANGGLGDKFKIIRTDYSPKETTTPTINTENATKAVETVKKSIESIPEAARYSVEKSQQSLMEALAAVHKAEDGVSRYDKAVSDAKADLASVEKSGLGMGTSEWDSAYIALQKVTDEAKRYKAALNQKSAGITSDIKETDSLDAKVDKLRANLKKMQSAGIGFGNKGFDKSYQELVKAESELKTYKKTLNDTGKDAGSFQKRMIAAFSNIGKNIKSSSASIGSFFSRIKNGFSSQRKLSSGFGGIASKLTKLVIGVNAAKGAFNGLKSAMDYSSNLTEVQNVVDVGFGKYKSKIEDLAKTSIQDYGMSELTAKKIAGRFQAMGTAVGFSQKKMSGMSVELTKLSADMASFYNEDQEKIAKSMQSVFTGTTQPLRKYGIDLTQATLQEWAHKQGIDANIKSMSQAEKTMLRYQYVISQTGAAQGDFARTSNTWANQTRMLKQNFQQLGSTIGQIAINAFKPFVKAMNSTLVQLDKFAKSARDALGKIFGWEYEEGGGVTQNYKDDMEDAADGANDTADATKKATKAQKEFNKQLQGFDRLNNLTSSKGKDNDGTGNGSGTSVGDLSNIGSGSGGKWKQKDSIIKKFESDIDTLEKLGKKIADALSKAMESIPWNKVYEKAKGFGAGLASFLNGLFTGDSGKRLFKNLGKTIANAINTAMYALLEFAKTYNWKSFGENLAAGFNSFFKNWDPGLTADTFNAWVNGILDAMIAAVTGIDWKDVAQKIADLIAGIDAKGIMWRVGKLANGLVNAFYDLVSNEETWTNIGTKIADGINGFFKGMGSDGWKKLGNSISKTISGFATAITTALKKVKWEKVGQAIGDFISGIKFGKIAFDLLKLAKALAKAIAKAIKGSMEKAPIETALIGIFATLKFTGLGKWVFNKLASKVMSKIALSLGAEEATKAGIGTAIAKSVGGALSKVPAAIGTFMSSGAAATAASVLGGVVAALGAAFVGFHLGKWIGDKLVSDDMKQYKYDFKFKDLFTYDPKEWAQGIKDWWGDVTGKNETEGGAGHSFDVKYKVDTSAINKADESLKKTRTVTTKLKAEKAPDFVDGYKKYFQLKNRTIKANLKMIGDIEKLREMSKNPLLTDKGKANTIKKTVELEVKLKQKNGKALQIDESTLNVLNNISKKADGGIFSGGKWKSIKGYAGGGAPNMGQVFMAREAGPELVGTINRHTAVMNNDQIVASVSDGVFNALNPVLTKMVVAINKMNSAGKGQALYVEGVSDGDIVRITTDANEKFKKTNGRPLYA